MVKLVFEKRIVGTAPDVEQPLTVFVEGHVARESFPLDAILVERVGTVPWVADDTESVNPLPKTCAKHDSHISCSEMFRRSPLIGDKSLAPGTEFPVKGIKSGAQLPANAAGRRTRNVDEPKSMFPHNLSHSVSSATVLQILC